MAEEIQKRTLYRHPLAAVGGSLFLAGAFLFLILLFYDFSAAHENPYRSLVTFVAVPFIITLGAVLFLIAIWRQVKQAREQGRKVRFSLSIDPTDPKYMRNLWLFLGLLAGLLVVVVYSGTKAYDATDSVAFCGETCHSVMHPQFVTYHNSPHARVPCVECHIGPGASFWVQSKIDGIRQVYAIMFNTYQKPIHTPIMNLRPAQQTCEGCHWPEQFYGEKLLTRTYYRTDEENSPWTINLLMKIGGGNPRTGREEGIHWHMISANHVEYIATDEKRQKIPWVRMISEEGDTVVYTREGDSIPDPTSPDVEVRKFDCIDCHNRPSHKFLPPATSMNLALSTRDISPDLPYIREQGLELLNADYSNKDSALHAIDVGLHEYYQEKYPDTVAAMQTEIGQAVQSLQKIYRLNFFPSMDTDYRARENNLSHFVNDGCFRCHDGSMKSASGKAISHDCRSCHLIVAQGPSEDVGELTSDVTGLEFQHPEDIFEAWREMKCTDCHTPESGY